jgi:anti-sigma-K factor RskA
MVLGWAGWAVAAGLAFVAYNFYHINDALKVQQAGQQQLIARLNDDAAKAHTVSDMLTDPAAMKVTLTPTKMEMPAMPTARVTYSAAKGTLILQANNMEPLQTYKTYELWLIPADGRDPMPAGTFHPDLQGNVSMVDSDIQKGVVAKEFGITVEDEGGSKVPSTPIIMVGM